jgi:hypothetical protein
MNLLYAYFLISLFYFLFPDFWPLISACPVKFFEEKERSEFNRGLLSFPLFYFLTFLSAVGVADCPSHVLNFLSAVVVSD